MKRRRRRTKDQDDLEDQDNDGMTAYSALLTLLKDKKPQKPRAAASTKAKRKKVHEDDSEDIEGIINNVNGTSDVSDVADNEDEEIGMDMEIDLDDAEENSQDPFEFHFAHPNVPESLKSIQVSQAKMTFPQINGNRSLIRTVAPSLGQQLNVRKFDDLPLKYRLQSPYKQISSKTKTRSNDQLLTELQISLSKYLFQYSDVLFPALSSFNEEEIQDLVLLHALNHIYKTRDRVLKNNAKISSQAKAKANKTESDNIEEVEYRDQGFTRPKVLLLAPTRNFAYEMVMRLADISGLNQVENRKRFQDAFFDQSELSESKPDDMRRAFKGNTNDMFCLGVKFTRQALRLYSSFYASDLIIASPLGLRLIIEKGDYDFLSSIEVCVLTNCHLLQMQSWENVEKIMRHINLIPKESHDCDFSRVRPWCLDEKSSWLRQTVMLSEYLTPEINALYSSSSNIGGGIKVRPVYDEQQAAVAKIGARVHQTLMRLNSSTPANDPDVRFKSFVSQVLPSLMRSSSSEGTLIFIPSYLDFVRVRNYMDDKNYSFLAISEYSTQSDTSRARAHFANGKTSILLYTERLHHFRRYSLKGVKEIIFYGLPDCPRYYSEVMRFLIRTNIETGIDLSLLKAKVLYSQWDNLKLERIVGSTRLGPLIKGINDIYEYA